MAQHDAWSRMTAQSAKQGKFGVHAMQLNNPGVQQSIHQALQHDPNFTQFMEGVQVTLHKQH